MIEATGLFDQEHLELIDGELISKMGKKRPHVDAAAFLLGWLIQVFGYRLVNEWARARQDRAKAELLAFRIHFTAAADLELVVEVAHTSLTFDLAVKAGLYARAGIVEYWVLDVSGRRLVVHRDPQEGGYRPIVAFSEDESVAPLAARYIRSIWKRKSSPSEPPT
jgi:Uma2 family endonuclease